MSDRSEIIINDLKNYLRVRLLEKTDLPISAREELLDLLLKLTELSNEK